MVLSCDKPCSIALLAYRQVERVDDEPCCWHRCRLQVQCGPAHQACAWFVIHRQRVPWHAETWYPVQTASQKQPSTHTQLRSHVPPRFRHGPSLARPGLRQRPAAQAAGPRRSFHSKREPKLCQGSLAGRYVLGDGLTQRLLERREHDWRRSCLFGSFGAVMGAPAYLFYVPWMPGFRASHSRMNLRCLRVTSSIVLLRQSFPPGC